MSYAPSIALALVVSLAPSVLRADEQTSLVALGAKLKKLASGMKFTEGPVWLPDEKKLVFSDIPNSKLMQWRQADGLSVFRRRRAASLRSACSVRNTRYSAVPSRATVSCTHGSTLAGQSPVAARHGLAHITRSAVSADNLVIPPPIVLVAHGRIIRKV